MENGQTFSVNDSPVKVLVVDDHPNTANMLARAISRLGPNVDVFSATSGYEALKYADNGAADILITDMMMPEMTGLELIEALNDQPSKSPAVSFLLTAHDSTGLRNIAQCVHVKQVIAKPVHPEWICELILQTMDELKQSKHPPQQTTLMGPDIEQSKSTHDFKTKYEHAINIAEREFRTIETQNNENLATG